MMRRRHIHRPPDHHGYRGLVDHFIESRHGRRWHGRPRERSYYGNFGRTLLRASIPACDKCVAADARDARLRRMHTAYSRRRS